MFFGYHKFKYWYILEIAYGLIFLVTNIITTINIKNLGLDTASDILIGISLGILAIETVLYIFMIKKEMFKEELLGKFSHYFVVEVNNRAVAYMGMWSLSGEGHITNIAVAKNERRKGYAKALLIHFINMIITRFNFVFFSNQFDMYSLYFHISLPIVLFSLYPLYDS